MQFRFRCYRTPERATITGVAHRPACMIAGSSAPKRTMNI
jgi:hypothetical protein